MHMPSKHQLGVQYIAFEHKYACLYVWPIRGVAAARIHVHSYSSVAQETQTHISPSSPTHIDLVWHFTELCDRACTEGRVGWAVTSRPASRLGYSAVASLALPRSSAAVDKAAGRCMIIWCRG
jgi:hypothetical protein